LSVAQMVKQAQSHEFKSQYQQKNNNLREI
jgi:hypothetical protein